MTLKEIQPTDVYQLLGTKYYRIPGNLEGARQEKIRWHLIYISTLMLLQDNDKFDEKDLEYIQGYFDMKDPSTVKKEDTMLFPFDNGLRARVPKDEVRDYIYINRAINKYIKFGKDFQKLKHAYEDFVSVIKGQVKFKDFVDRYLSDGFTYKKNLSNDEQTYDEVINEIEGFIMNLSRREIHCSLVKFITDQGKPTLGTIVYSGREEHMTIITFQPKDEIALLINVYPHLHFLVQFNVENDKISSLMLIDSVISNYFNYKNIGVHIESRQLSTNN